MLRLGSRWSVDVYHAACMISRVRGERQAARDHRRAPACRTPRASRMYAEKSASGCRMMCAVASSCVVLASCRMRRMCRVRHEAVQFAYFPGLCAVVREAMAVANGAPWLSPSHAGGHRSALAWLRVKCCTAGSVCDCIIARARTGWTALVHVCQAACADLAVLRAHNHYSHFRVC